MRNDLVSISIVSHGQGRLVEQVLRDLAKLTHPKCFQVILTINKPERLPFDAAEFPFSLICIENETPKGFGANHNAAFHYATGKFFCVVNPDIRLDSNPFPSLQISMSDGNVGAVGPLVFAISGRMEDSARHFPTPWKLFLRIIRFDDGRYRLVNPEAGCPVDWIAGMFMLVRSEAFSAVGGFDEGFFLYYEDVDLCVRLWKNGWRVLACPQAQVIHDARRESHRNLRYLRWHLASLLRYFRKHWLRLPKTG